MGISIKALSKYFGSKLIFDKLNFEFPDKGLVLITGRSGSGKTTLLRILSGIDRIYDGEIIGTYSVSYAFQEYRLLPWLSAIDNLTVAAFQSASVTEAHRAREMLTRLSFKENELSLYPSQLSGGMKQRVSLARAFLHDADVLILDEPTKELDRSLCDTVYELIEEQSKNRLVILVTHEDVPSNLEIAAKLSI